ncbi:hypothetical protein GCK32_015635, partial [Trichostrongylus colubriformis]
MRIDLMPTIVLIWDTTEFVRRSAKTAGECSCISETGKVYDFCYRLPQNKTIKGKRFSCDHLPTLASLGLLDSSELPFAPSEINPMFVAAFSANHEYEAVFLMESIAEYFPNIGRMIVYDLGKVNHTLFREFTFLEFRMFNYSRYPSYANFLQQYRWKPLMIA